MSVARMTEQRFDHRAIDAKWQRRWEEQGAHKVDDHDPRPKWYELTMYPYPSGDLHIGHWYAMGPSDAHARLRRMQGYNVLHPMGFDAFGLPAENAAIRNGIHPYKWTIENMENMRRQLRSLGAIYDWDREVVTCDPEYYKWNQWFFLRMYESGLAYRAFAPANWCPSCNTTLANEQVLSNGTCERCNATVTHKDLNQWFFRITKYADELLDHSKKEWPADIDTMQTNWIGRSEGVDITFDISEYGLDAHEITTYTTRIDTIYGVTFVVLAPEHPLVDALTTPEHKAAVDAYVRQARLQNEIERLSTEKEKTGVFTGAYCVNRLNGERAPIFVGDYVLLTYGTGIVMGVPAHDERDFVFAKKYDLPIRVVVAPDGWDGAELQEAYLAEGVQVNSDRFDGLPSAEGWQRIADYIEANGWGERTVQYRMRDWLISRQRYWGTPIPIIYCDDCGDVAVPYEDLPVLLPEDAEFRPTGESPLGLSEDFLNVDCPKCGGPAQREPDTMDTFVDSSWYFLRFTNARYADGAFDPDSIKRWGSVDQYTGGREHAVMHLLYARFFVKALRDMGMLDFDEPFDRLFNQGVILGADHEKMSKSRGNVIAPDEYVNAFGADAVRCFLMFLGPWDQGGSWSDSGINGMARWMNRVWDVATRDAAATDASPSDADAMRELQRLMHKTIHRVGDDLERFKFNTALAALMEYTNGLNHHWEDGGIPADLWNEAIRTLLLLLSPMAPHISAELWECAGNGGGVHSEAWPEWDEALAADEVITLVVQVNGRVRDKIDAPVTITEEAARAAALGSGRVAPHIDGKRVARVIYVPGKLVNVVAR